ncbi:amidohydrolase [Lineolata rhizophorae]|uniref:Amidohydrolase n=1 Tax=Lineolata rhizophorae TaxID=578093 RepID=A0A6A6P9K3_9PEZI|nr:amidohydrolase [Lineolata rhizophorae]
MWSCRFTSQQLRATLRYRRSGRPLWRRAFTSVPSDAWDSHMHVIDPVNFPLSRSATYTPHTALLAEALENAAKLQLPNLVLVQPSPYGLDNSCLLDALDRVGPDRGRGVVAFDPASTSLQTLRDWHERGVRGVRVNLKSVGREMEPKALVEMLRSYVEAIRPLRSWVLELFVDMSVVPHLEPVQAELDGIKLVLAHLGAPARLKWPLHDMPGWSHFRKFMENPDFYVKVSAPYRLSKDPEFRDLEGLVKESLGARGGNAVLFASDWPHTRFEAVDVQPWITKCLEWCGRDQALRDKLFRDNAKILWDVQ